MCVEDARESVNLMPSGVVPARLCEVSAASPSAATRQTATSSDRTASQTMGIRTKSMDL